MLGYVRSFAAGFGIDDLAPPARLASTRRAHAVAQLARDAGRLDRCRVAAFDAYWRQGRGLESDEELAALAREAGLDRGRGARRRRGPGHARPRGRRPSRGASAAGVTGIPTFDFGERPDRRLPALRGARRRRAPGVARGAG